MRAAGFGRILAQEPSRTFPWQLCGPLLQPRGYSCMESEKQINASQAKAQEGAVMLRRRELISRPVTSC